jgi:cell division protein FtsW (lipid II flippase)
MLHIEYFCVGISVIILFCILLIIGKIIYDFIKDNKEKSFIICAIISILILAYFIGECIITSLK